MPLLKKAFSNEKTIYYLITRFSEYLPSYNLITDKYSFEKNKMRITIKYYFYYKIAYLPIRN